MELKNWTELERGRAAELARNVGVSQPTMARWVAGEEIPLERCQQIEQFTNGQVTCEEMRPDKVEYFAYMRSRPTPEVAGVGVLMPGDATGYNAMHACTKAA